MLTTRQDLFNAGSSLLMFWEPAKRLRSFINQTTLSPRVLRQHRKSRSG